MNMDYFCAPVAVKIFSRIRQDGTMGLVNFLSIPDVIMIGIHIVSSVTAIFRMTADCDHVLKEAIMPLKKVKNAPPGISAIELMPCPRFAWKNKSALVEPIPGVPEIFIEEGESYRFQIAGQVKGEVKFNLSVTFFPTKTRVIVPGSPLDGARGHFMEFRAPSGSDSCRITLSVGGSGEFVASSASLRRIISKPPDEPYVLLPTGIQRDRTVRVEWRGEEHEVFQVRVTSKPLRHHCFIYESGPVHSHINRHVIDKSLPEGQTFYVWVRLRNTFGWGHWNRRTVPFIIAPIAPLRESVHVYDLRPTIQESPARAFEQAHFVAALQGIVNRHAPRLYIHFVKSYYSPLNVDEYWLAQSRKPDGWLEHARLVPVRDIEKLIAIFKRDIKGVVLWDPAVPATSNVASTIAGADNLVPLPWDETKGSLYNRLVKGGPHLKVIVDLRGLFTGKGTIPGTQRPSTGSAKCDAYIWAVEHYLKTGRSNPAHHGFYLDAWWIRNPEAGGEVQNHTLTNHDYFISHRGFFWDLLVWKDEAPVDDPGQKTGTDYNTLIEILKVSFELTEGQSMIHVGGFTPWAFKYTKEPGAGGKHGGVHTEWQTVMLLSAFNAYIDADALSLSALANASFFQHMRLPDIMSQPLPLQKEELVRKGLVSSSGRPAVRNYILHYAGDWDSAAWLTNSFFPTWDASERGTLSMTWPINPSLCERAPHVFDYLFRTRSGRDTFSTGDSGAGYVNATQLLEPRKISGLPSGKEAWIEHCAKYYGRFQMRFTGFLINGLSGCLSPEAVSLYEAFSWDGAVVQNSCAYSPPYMEGRMPVFVMGDDLSGDIVKDADTIHSRSKPGNTSFQIFRSILKPYDYYTRLNSLIQESRPDMVYEICDAGTFSRIAKLSLGGNNNQMASILYHTLPDTLEKGGKHRFEIAIRNDGWDDWSITNPQKIKLIMETRTPDGAIIKHEAVPLKYQPFPGNCVVMQITALMPSMNDRVTVVLDLEDSDGRRFSLNGSGLFRKDIRLVHSVS